MERYVTILVLLFIGVAPLFGAEDGQRVMYHGQKTAKHAPRKIVKVTHVSAVDQAKVATNSAEDEGPKPLTEQEQRALMKKMGLSNIEENGSSRGKGIDHE